jgi:hypothetical protein
VPAAHACRPQATVQWHCRAGSPGAHGSSPGIDRCQCCPPHACTRSASSGGSEYIVSLDGVQAAVTLWGIQYYFVLIAYISSTLVVCNFAWTVSAIMHTRHRRAGLTICMCRFPYPQLLKYV